MSETAQAIPSIPGQEPWSMKPPKTEETSWRFGQRTELLNVSLSLSIARSKILTDADGWKEQHEKQSHHRREIMDECVEDARYLISVVDKAVPRS